MTSTAAATAKVLADAGIERVFGLPGGEVLVLMDELRRAGVDFVLMRHEANAGIAAAVYGKLRRQPGVVLTTLGPGAANLMLPMSNAYLDCEPLLAIRRRSRTISRRATRTSCCRCTRPTVRSRATSRRSPARTCSTSCRRALARCMERPFGASYLTLSAREALKPAADGAARVVGDDTTLHRRCSRTRGGARGRAAGLEASPGRDWARHRRGERGGDPPLADGVEPAGRGDAEGQGNRRRDRCELRRRRRRDGGRRRGVRGDRGGGRGGRLRPRSGRDRQDVARGTTDSLGARIAERLRRRAGGSRARQSPCAARCARRRAAAGGVDGAVQGIPGRAEADAGRSDDVARDDVARRHRRGAGVGDAAGHDCHDRRRLAQVPVRAVLAEPRAGNVLDVERACREWRTG